MKLRVAFYAFALLCSTTSLADISGTIVDNVGNPVPDARVFVEPGIEGAVIEGTVSANGVFEVLGDFYGSAGVFAIAPRFGFGGVHLNVASGDDPANIRISLLPAAAVRGKVTDTDGDMVSGARLNSIAITAPVKVGIPLSKLTAYGVSLPETDASGNFSIGFVPEGATLALKIDHPMYAQEAVTEISAGDTKVHVVLHRGVMVRGEVTIRGSDAVVSGAVVTARNAQPPHDTAFTASDRSGVFSLRLKPGVYLFQAFATGRISPGLKRVDISGQLPEQNLKLSLSQTSAITGTINDAKSGDPIAGVRVLLETQGQPAGAARTGADGRFKLNAAAGDNLLIFDAVPGYLPPDTKALRVNAPGGETLKLPGLWLAPIPAFKLRVFDRDGETPVSHAFISLLRPKQFGWQQTDADGRVTLRFSNLPEDNRVIGLVEHPAKAAGALFALDRRNAEDGTVALLPFAQVTGQVENEQNEGVAGATVGALFADDALPGAVPLWRCVTDGDGEFYWPAVLPGVPQRCLASVGSINEAAVMDINPAPKEKMDVGTISLSGAVSVVREGEAHWPELTHCCGPVATSGKSSVVLLCCTPAEAAVYIQAATTMQTQLSSFNTEVVVAVSGVYICSDAAVPVYTGNVMPQATCVYDANDTLRLRVMGLPPITLLQQLKGGS